MKKNLIITIVLVLLVVISVVQAVQLIGMNSKIKNISSTGASIKTTSSSSSIKTTSPGSVPTNLQNLPGMVGGC